MMNFWRILLGFVILFLPLLLLRWKTQAASSVLLLFLFLIPFFFIVYPWKSLRGLLYILQNEQYSISRFFQWLLRHFLPRHWPKAEQRKKIVWTLKVQLLFGLTVLLHLIFFFLLGVLLSYPTTMLVFIFVDMIGALNEILPFFTVALALLPIFLISILFLPLLVVMSLTLLWPFDFIAKKIIVRRAKQKLQDFPQLKIIGITGSYGKTTMKEVIASLLQTKYQVLSSSENINTLLGIAVLILKELQPHHEIFVAEMGAFQKGDIQQLCELAPPRISILTGINEAHLERFGSLENTIEAKFEIVKYMRSDGTAYLNGKNELIRKNADRFAGGKNVKFFPDDDLEILNAQWQKHGGYRFEIWHKKQKLFETTTKILGSYILDTLLCAIMIAKQFDIPHLLIAETIPKIQPIPHRLFPMPTANDVLVIDDAYNGNPDGAKEAMAVLKRFHDRRKIYLTPGLVEMGPKSQTIHEKLGKVLASCADLVLLIRNSVTPFLEKGLESARFPQENIVWFETTKQAHDALMTLLKPGDVIIFQNDWSDNYF